MEESGNKTQNSKQPISTFYSKTNEMEKNSWIHKSKREIYNFSILVQTFEELENEATRNEEGAEEHNPWHADLFGTMNLEQVGTWRQNFSKIHIIKVEN